MCSATATTPGSAEVSVATGGVAPFGYAWSPGGAADSTVDNLTAGVYTVTVTDDNGCTSMATVTITQPNANAVTQTLTLCGGEMLPWEEIPIRPPVHTWTYLRPLTVATVR